MEASDVQIFADRFLGIEEKRSVVNRSSDKPVAAASGQLSPNRPQVTQNEMEQNPVRTFTRKRPKIAGNERTGENVKNSGLFSIE